MSLTEIAIKRPSLIIVLFGVFILGGLFAFKQLSYELMPDFAQPVITVRTMYPGASPEEVESSLTKKLEDALSNLENIDYVDSKSLENASVIIVTMKYGTDPDLAMQNAQRYIENIRSTLPEDVQSPVMSKISPNDLPIMQISAVSNLPGIVFYQKMKDEYLPGLQQIKGVAEITLLGGEQREIQIKVDKSKLRHYRLSLLQVSEAVNRAGLDVPAGKVRSESEQINVKLAAKFNSVKDVNNIVVANPPHGSPVYLRDVATVVDGVQEMQSVSRYNGQNGIGMLLKKQGDANAVDVSAAVKSRLKEIEAANTADGVQFIIGDDTSDNTIAAVDSVVKDLGLAILLVATIMLLFLHSIRNSLIVLVAIPTSLVTTFSIMWLFGYTLNLMTLLAMSLVIGILVDDSIVVLENIQRFLEKGKDKVTAAIEGRNEIGFAALSITLVDVVVFLPVTFLNVTVADILKQFSVVVVVSTLTSLLVSFTLTPWLASRLGKVEHLDRSNLFQRFLLWFERQLDALTGWYGVQLKWVLSHKLIFTGFILLLFAATGAMVKQGITGKELIATGDQGKFLLYLEFDKSATLARNNLVSREAENYLLGQPEVATVFSNVGGPSTGIGSIGLGAENKTELTVTLLPKKERGGVSTEQYMRRIREELQQQYAGVDFTMSALGLVPRSAPVEITLSGEDFPEVMQTAQELKGALTAIPGANNVRLSIEEGSPEVNVSLDREKMARLGLNTAIVGATLRNAFAGNDNATLTENGTEYPLLVSLDNFERKNAEDVKGVLFPTSMGQSVLLEEFAAVNRKIAPSRLERHDRRSAVTLTADALGRGSGSVADDVLAYLEQNPLPQGMGLVWGSDVKRQMDSFGAMGLAMIASLILVYLIMVALYDNFVYPFVVLFSIPVAVIGAFLALNLTISNLSIFSLLGLLMLLGLVAKNAILIVDFTNQLKATGIHFREALVEAGKIRLRPIMMTTIAMVFGMLPIALATGTASEWKNGLAWALIGGLTSSMLLTVFLVPVVYYAVDAVGERIGKWRDRGFQAA
ncbi:MAG: efflux RND transporter permease subunit [Saprospiraceae bacterium]|nr:efflux RND transporter permease subunit [Saprospiraceae bacterium]MCF8251910.1 efflux RND transporter permease subunit [Saprospiraceae bacterium]MCF8281597.1 efflux RND transporter permease subunit [Bacteroidales bacterium]MCF8313574.1 efflux RND transporter permease subunit [Saprospiraceae bacterium]MCF8442294.1 efflux RND transporter permease subunit [Saprospiraceae bacterium]